MYDKTNPSFQYTVNANYISKHFKEFSRSGKYYSYVSKDFYGAVIRSKKPLFAIDADNVVMAIRYKGHGRDVTGIKIDLIEFGDDRIEEYDLTPGRLPRVTMEVESNIPNNLIINPEPTLLTCFFYKNKEGSSIINIIPE